MTSSQSNVTLSSVKNSNHTKDRLLEKAEILFAHKGYHAISVREITSAAQCNMAAVNYHFNNKKNLYMEVFRSRWIPRELRMYEAFEKSPSTLYRMALYRCPERT